MEDIVNEEMEKLKADIREWNETSMENLEKVLMEYKVVAVAQLAQMRNVMLQNLTDYYGEKMSEIISKRDRFLAGDAFRLQDYLGVPVFRYCPSLDKEHMFPYLEIWNSELGKYSFHSWLTNVTDKGFIVKYDFMGIREYVQNIPFSCIHFEIGNRLQNSHRRTKWRIGSKNSDHPHMKLKQRVKL